MPLKDWIRLDQLFRDAWKRRWYIRWIIIALPILLILAILGSVMAFVQPFLKVIATVLGILVDNKIGRFVLLNLVILLVLFLLFKKGKKVVSSLFGFLALSRFLDGLKLLAMEDCTKALNRFKKVYRIGKYFDLEKWVPAYPEIDSHSVLNIALCCQKLGQYNEGMKWLEILSSRQLNTFLKKNLLEVRAVIYALNNELLPETVEKEIEGALKNQPKNVRILYARRDRFLQSGDLAKTIPVQERVCRVTSGGEKEREKKRLCTLYLQHGRNLLAQGQVMEAREAFQKASDANQANPLPLLLLGDMEMEAKNAKAALDFWSKIPSYPVMERLRAALHEGTLSKKRHLPILLKKFPNAGILSVISEHFMNCGESEKAERLVEKLYSLGFHLPTLHRKLGDHFLNQGREDAAAQQYRKALYLFLMGLAESPAA